MIPSVVTVTVDGQAHRVVIPHEWSGGVAIVVNCHRGFPSKKILVGRLASIILVPDGDHDNPRLESGGSPAVGGAGQEAVYGGEEETPPESAQG